MVPIYKADTVFLFSLVFCITLFIKGKDFTYFRQNVFVLAFCFVQNIYMEESF